MTDAPECVDKEEVYFMCKLYTTEYILFMPVICEFTNINEFFFFKPPPSVTV